MKNKIDFFEFGNSPIRSSAKEFTKNESALRLAEQKSVSIKEKLKSYSDNKSLNIITLENELRDLSGRLDYSINVIINRFHNTNVPEVVLYIIQNFKEIKRLESYADKNKFIQEIKYNSYSNDVEFENVIDTAIEIFDEVSINLGITKDLNAVESLFSILNTDFTLKEVLFEKINNEENIDFYRKKLKYTRINYNDIQKLNSIVREMNEDGWVLKQIESIQSGNYDYKDYPPENSYGFGYSYTEGILILWEKND